MFNKNILIVGAVLAWIFLPKTACAQVTVDVRGETRSLEHYWSYGVGAGRVGEALRAGWQEQLDLAMEHCGYKYIRMHALFNDDMFIYKRRQGKDLYNFQYLDEVYDRLVDKGIRPFVELSFFPRDIAAKNSKTQFWYKAYFTPDPLRFGRWAELVKATVSHLVERYGIEEVSQWYFEVWNEPDLTDGFFDGTRDEYFQLYKCTAEAATAPPPMNSWRMRGMTAPSRTMPFRRHSARMKSTNSSGRRHGSRNSSNSAIAGTYLSTFCPRTLIPWTRHWIRKTATMYVLTGTFTPPGMTSATLGKPWTPAPTRGWTYS